jgi:hypothetical protein
MNRVSQIGVRLIRESLRPGLLIASVVLLSMQAIAGPDDKDKNRRAPSGPLPAPTRSVDSGPRSQPSFKPPSRPVITDSAPRMNRSSSGEGLRGTISGPPSRPIVSNPPSGGGSAPTINRNPVSAGGGRAFGGNPAGGVAPRSNTANLKPLPKIDAPKISGTRPTVTQPKVLGPLPPVSKNSAGGSGVSGAGASSPQIARPPIVGSQGGRRALNGDLRLEAQRDNRLNDRRPDGAGNSANRSPNQTIDKPANQNIDRPINKMPDRPIEKPRDLSSGGGNSGGNLIDKGRLDRNNAPPAGGGVKKLDNPPHLQKGPDAPGNLKKDIGNPNLQKGTDRIVPPPGVKKLDNPGLQKGPDAPGNLKKDTGAPNLQKGPGAPGDLKKNSNFGPKKDADKIVPPPDVKKPDDRGGLKTDLGGRKDAFQPGRFDRNRTNKDSTLDPKGTAIDKAKTGEILKGGDLKGDRFKGQGDKVKGGSVTGDGIKGGNLKGTPPDLRKDAGKPLTGPKRLGPQPLKGEVLPADAAAANLKNVRAGMNNKRFDERVKSGELDKLTKGDIAKKVDLHDQFKHMHEGDVARRLNLQHKTARAADLTVINNRTIVNLRGIPTRHGHFYGSIHPHYADNCFKYRYWGPSFFAGPCWYPHWNPWVVWSWHYQCNSFWDPRPYWCRPIVYTPYVVWNYWEPPVWQPLMDVSCGTWVDVKPVVVEPEKFDLQLLAVRMVDPGHPEEKLGPRYRVWFRNNSGKPITDPFSVMLFAANDRKFGQDLPRAGVRVTSIEAGDTQSVDIRLPIDVMTMNKDAAGEPAPFEVLHFFVDANREVNDLDMANNGAVVPREEMLPVDPAAFEIDPVQAAAGGEMIVAGEGFGPQPGQVLLHIGNQEAQAEIVGWYDLGVKFAAPKIEITMPTEAEVIVIRGDGAAANPLKITLLPDNAEGPALEIPSAPDK